MKTFSKILLSATAVATVSAAMAVSAMAADTLIGSYDSVSGNVTIEGAVSTGTSQTLLVLNNDAEVVAAEDIEQIDQRDDGAVFTSFVLPAGLTEGTYYIRIGGDGTIQTGTLTINGGGGTVETITIIIGDADLGGTVDSGDVGFVLGKANGKTTRIGKAGQIYKKASDGSDVIIGDADLGGTVDSGDVGFILGKANGKTTRIGKAGQKIEVIKPAE